MRTIIKILVCLLGANCRGSDRTVDSDVIIADLYGELGWLGYFGPTDPRVRSVGCAQRGTDSSGVISSDGEKICSVSFASDYENALCVLSDDRLRAPANSKGFHVSGKFVGTLAYSCVGAYGSNDVGLTKAARSLPTPAAIACGENPTVVGNDFFFRITVGRGTGGCTVTFANAWVDLPAYAVTPEDGTPVTYTVSRSSVTLVSVIAGSTYDVGNISCESRNALPVVNCGEAATMNYDGCRWGCKRTITGTLKQRNR